MLHFTVDEVLNLLGIKYDKEQVTVQVTEGEHNKNTVSYVVKDVAEGHLVGIAKDTIEGVGKTAGEMVNIDFDVKQAVKDAGGGVAKVLPTGGYGKTVYKVNTPKTGEKSGIVSLTFSNESDYVMLKQEHWSAEFNSNRMGNGYQQPGYVNIYSHK